MYMNNHGEGTNRGGANATHQQQQQAKTFITIDTGALDHRHHHTQNHHDPLMNTFRKSNNPFATSPSSPGISSKTGVGGGLLAGGQLSQIIDMGKCVAGIYASFMIMSVYQERV